MLCSADLLYGHSYLLTSTFSFLCCFNVTLWSPGLNKHPACSWTTCVCSLTESLQHFLSFSPSSLKKKKNWINFLPQLEPEKKTLLKVLETMKSFTKICKAKAFALTLQFQLYSVPWTLEPLLNVSFLCYPVLVSVYGLTHSFTKANMKDRCCQDCVQPKLSNMTIHQSQSGCSNAFPMVGQECQNELIKYISK